MVKKALTKISKGDSLCSEDEALHSKIIVTNESIRMNSQKNPIKGILGNRRKKKLAEKGNSLKDISETVDFEIYMKRMRNNKILKKVLIVFII